MRTLGRRSSGAFCGILLSIAACGGGAAHEPAPKAGGNSAAVASASKAEAPSAEAGAASTSATTAPEKPEAPPAKESPKPTRPPHDVLVQKDTLFMLSFDDSDAGKATEATCNKEGGKDPKKVATCVVKERSKIEADGHGFKKDKDGNLTWVVVHRQGNVMVTIHKMHMSFANETDNTIVVKPEGKDTGKKPGRAAGEFTVEVPSDYRIIINDPKLGKLVYEAKIGLVPDNLL